MRACVIMFELVLF